MKYQDIKKIIYPFLSPKEVTNFTNKKPIDMANLPSWVEKEMEKVAKIEKCDIRKLFCKREIYYDETKLGWVDYSEIIKKF